MEFKKKSVLFLQIPQHCNCMPSPASSPNLHQLTIFNTQCHGQCWQLQVIKSQNKATAREMVGDLKSLQDFYRMNNSKYVVIMILQSFAN